jgi:conserved oligomeric Golgi complex subunit 4
LGCDFICGLSIPTTYSVTASSPLYYITALTALFESIAMIVDQHQPVVESYYGTGKMASVITRLLQECDRVCKGLIEGWEEERGTKRKVWKSKLADYVRVEQL